MNNPNKPATQDEEKQNKSTTQYVLYTTTHKQHKQDTPLPPPPPPTHTQTNGGKDKTEHSFHAEIARDFTTLNTERKKCLYIKESRSICTLWNFPFQIFQLINECCFVSVYTK